MPAWFTNKAYRAAGIQHQAVQCDSCGGPDREDRLHQHTLCGRRSYQLDPGVPEPRHTDVHGPKRHRIQSDGQLNRT